MQEPIISANSLVKKFGDFTAVNGVSFEIFPGEIFGFLGPNGSGKTTTIRMLLGILEITAGSATVLGYPVDGNTRQILPKVGYMSQKFSLYNDLTVLQNLQFYGAAYDLENAVLKERIRSALDMAGLQGKEDIQTKNLSGGWRQRLALSTAFLHQPKVLFLDEPTAGVDPVSRRAFWDLLYELVSDGVTVFVTTHYMDEAEHCHRLGFIQHGEIIAYGATNKIKKKMMGSDVLEIASSDAISTMKILGGLKGKKKFKIEYVELYGSLVHVVMPDAKKHAKKLKKVIQKQGISVEHLNVIEPSLEDVFIECMRE
jgi:ABC-2 type transport system ATP-binding protein